jgi:PIN domain nuclease of toxin-antitoxin system
VVERPPQRARGSIYQLGGDTEIMRYLLDTNIVLFLFREKDQLSKETISILNDDRNQIYVSSESVKELILLWESKHFTVKGWKSPEPIIDFILDDMMCEIKPMTEKHLRTLANLPRFEDHKDPFDRAIISHAITENITLVSSDGKFDRYERFGLDWIFNPKI